jgi:hypothetical protein
MIIFAVQKKQMQFKSKNKKRETNKKALKILGMTSQPPLTHLTKTLTMKKFYVFQEQR